MSIAWKIVDLCTNWQSQVIFYHLTVWCSVPTVLCLNFEVLQDVGKQVWKKGGSYFGVLLLLIPYHSELPNIFKSFNFIIQRDRTLLMEGQKSGSHLFLNLFSDILLHFKVQAQNSRYQVSYCQTIKKDLTLSIGTQINNSQVIKI